MPRPTIEDQNKKRILVQFRLRQEEKTKLGINAKMAGLSVTDFIKLKAIDIEPKRKKANPEREILIKGLSELGRIGSNINQIARVLNRGNVPEQDFTMKQIELALLEIKKLSDTILNELAHGD